MVRPPSRADEEPRGDGPEAVGPRGTATEGTLKGRLVVPGPATWRLLEPDGTEGAAVARRPVPILGARNEVGVSLHTSPVTTQAHALGVRVARMDGEVVPAGHLAEVALLEITAGEAAATHENLDGATIGGPALEGRKPKTTADQVGRQMVGLDEPTGGVAPVRPAPEATPCSSARLQGPRVAVRLRPSAATGRARQGDGGGRPTGRHEADATQGIAAPGLPVVALLGTGRATEDLLAGVGTTPLTVLGSGPYAGRATANGPGPTRVHVAAGTGATQNAASEGASSGKTSSASARTAAFDHEAKADPRPALVLAQVGGASWGHETELGRLLFLDVHYFNCEL